MNSLQQLHHFGQSVWLDYNRRQLISSGELQRLVTERAITGITADFSAFEKAISGSNDYQKAIVEQGDIQPKTIIEILQIADIQQATHILKPIYETSHYRDGYVCMTIPPQLANDSQATIAEVRRLWAAVNRPNLMIKIPATAEGILAIKTLISEGININATCIFSNVIYQQVTDAFMQGLEIRLTKGDDISTIASVASMAISPLDNLADSLIDEQLNNINDNRQRVLLKGIKGKVAIAHARINYQSYQHLFNQPRWQALADKGANSQRIVWTHTATNNPSYSDTLYVDELIGMNTVNAMSLGTMDSFCKKGQLSYSLDKPVDSAIGVLKILESALSLENISQQLQLVELEQNLGVFDKLLQSIDAAKKSPKLNIGQQSFKLPNQLQDSVNSTLDDWQNNNKVAALWAKDARLWTGTDEAIWLDWLDITQDQMAHIGNLTQIFEASQGQGIQHLVLLGMGGSSLAPDVFCHTYGKIDNHPELLILDSTDPAQIRQIEARIDYKHTKFIVSSKSGSTLEPNIFKEYFFTQASLALGSDKAAANNFFAITDPNSNLEKLAEAEGFRRIFHGIAGIGGRYSALSNFGLVPGAAMGINMANFIERSLIMVEACAACVPAQDNLGVSLGVVLACAASQGQDKLTFITSANISSLGAWLEQLIAESTGKQGRGIIPVDGEILTETKNYGNDRIFAYLRLSDSADTRQDEAVKQLAVAGHPVIYIDVPDIDAIGQEFFRWEIATAVAGSILKINAFNQPDVEASKIVTRELTEAFEKEGALPAETPLFEADGIALYTDERNANQLRALVGDNASLSHYLKAHLEQLGEGDYFALLGYVNRLNLVHETTLQSIRHRIRDTFKVATCLGFGPRFLHSTGQAYKGGPNSGVFLQITCDDAHDLAVPNHQYSFGVVKAAQARGDFSVLAERKRRALRVHLGKETEVGMKQLEALIIHAIES